MATNDISRSAFYFKKDYADLSMQQGRALTEDDYNEGRQIARELQRRTGVDLIGPYGSPDQGFSVVSNSTTTDNNGIIDFKIHEGTFYIGGLRLALSEEETFKLQKNWLQYTKATVVNNFNHLVYLEAWQQPVSAVEDSELFEVALGGPDTATRLRTMWRVKLHQTKEKDCANAWDEMVAAWKGAAAGKIAGTLTASNELIPDTTLQVAFDSTNVQKDFCKPSITGGYLGAENQAIRVQIVDKDHFTWGFDNGSPLYRVIVGTDNNVKRTVVKMLIEPKDQAHWPKAGQVVEFLPWSAVLVNGEKLAEESMPGHFAKVESGYDPDDKTKSISLTPATALPATYGEKWKDRSDWKELLENPFNKNEKLDEYLFMRVWDRGDDITSDPEIPITNKAKLGTTGLQATFNHNDRRPGDYWIIAARPETPNKVIPWQLEAERPPDGIRRFYAPLAIIEWSNGDILQRKVQDCRKTFRPLTELQTCCTRTVGTGTQSHGDFSDIQTAIDSLPSVGGEICLLPGNHALKQAVTLKNKKNVTIRGCGAWSKLQAQGISPALQIEDCEHIKITNLSIEVTTDVGIVLKGRPVDATKQKEATLKHIVVANLTISARDRAAIVCTNGRFISLRDNHIHLNALSTTLGDNKKIGREPAVFLQADDVICEGNHIKTIEDGSQVSSKTALGGLQIGGGSDRVEIRRNKIEGGNGNGITLGSVRYVAVGSASIFEVNLEFWGFLLEEDINGCIRLIPDPQPPIGEDGAILIPESDGSLTDVRIIDNIIKNMGSNGIGVAHFFDLSTKRMISINRLVIEDNQIRDCRRLALKKTPSQDIGYGGIALATGQYVVIRNNTIEDNGTNPVDPTCGIFVLNAISIAVEGNRILYNGGARERTSKEEVPKGGNRGGIIISFAQPKTETVTVAEDIRRPKLIIARQDGVPAARIHDNIVVSPEGRALKLLALGPVSVQGNQFTSYGSTSLDPRDSIDFFGGAVATVVNLGVLNELYVSLLGLANTEDLQMQSRPSIGGNIQFNNNQIVFDVLDKAPSHTFSSLLLISLDDISMTANQSDCDLSAGDFVLTNTLAIGISVRVADNWFKEGLFSAWASAATLGWFNTTTDNQGTHCFLTNGINKLSMTENNRDLSLIFQGWECERLQGIWQTMTKSLIPSNS
jgi:hypothetical protein